MQRSRRALLSSLAGVAVLGGCSGESGESSTTQSTETATRTATATPTETATATETATRTATSTPEPPAGGRPAVVDLELSTRFREFLPPDPAELSPYESIVPAYSQVVVRGRFYDLRTPSRETTTERQPRCGAVPVQTTTVRAVPAEPPGGSKIRKLSALDSPERAAVERAVSEGSYTVDQSRGGIDETETQKSVPDDLPPVTYVRADRPYLVATFRSTGPACAITVPTWLLERASERTDGPVIHAVDASADPVREALETAVGGTYSGDGDPPEVLAAIARRFDYVVASDGEQQTATYYQPSLSKDGEEFTLQMRPVTSGPIGPN